MLLLGAAFFAATASAADKPKFVEIKVTCPHVSEVANEVWNCGANKYAAMEAQDCSDQVIASWTAAAAALQPLLIRDAGNKQDTSQTNTRSDYDNALARLDSQIVLMENYTNLIAEYAHATINFPDAESQDESPPCFNGPFDKIQDVVSNLDQQIIMAKKVRKLAAGMRGTSDQYHKNLANSLSDAIASGRLAAKGGPANNSASDVTGLKEAREKAKKLAATGQTRKLDDLPLATGSDVTRTPHRNTAEPVRAADAVAKIFDKDLSSPPVPASVTAKPGAIAPPSAGAAIWDDNFAGDKLSLGVNKAGVVPAPGAQKKSGGIASAVSSDGAAGVSGGALNGASPATQPPQSEPATANESPASSRASSAPVVASSDTDLFALVHDRYRASELFRKARIISV
ncbi:MAG: hypothetical protein ACXVB9_04850, partial [Bdellovibrionota bacterium]